MLQREEVFTVDSLTSSRQLLASEMDDLRRPVLRVLCCAALAVSSIWIMVILMVHLRPPPLAVLAPPFLMFCASLGCLTIRILPISGRAALLLLGLTGSLVLGYWASPSRDWLYALSLVVVMGGAAAGPVVSFATSASLSVLTLLSLFLVPGAPSLAQVPAPLGLLWGSALISGLSSQSLYATLRWAVDSQARAWQTAEEVRIRRGELRRVLDSLRVTHGQLERTVRELEVARAVAEEAREIKSRFVANISHEFRTPLNIIVGFAEMLCTSPETYGGLTWSPLLREDIVSIWRNAEHLLKMVDDVLDLAQIEALRLPVLPEPVDLISVIQEALAMDDALLRDSCLELRVSLPENLPRLTVDPTRIRQVLLNLINNAVRFTHQGYLEVGAFLSGAEIVVYVRDTGEGIPPEKLETIFERFEQVDTSARRPHSGLGLGLAISRHLVRLHGGRIWAESELGKGSTFYFSLPYLEPGSQPRVPQLIRTPADRAPAAKNEAVVALCADPMAVRMLARHLEKLNVAGAESTAEAVALVHELHPLAILIVGDQQQALTEARAVLDEMGALDVATIVCDFPTERQAGRALGVSDFLIKPITQRELAAAIKRLRTAPRRVLVVDDDPDMLRLLGRMTQQEWREAEVLLAASGEEAIRLASQLPDIVLLDLLMPGINGVEILGRLRSDPVTAGIPVVVITARTPAEDLAALRECEVHILRKRALAAGEMVRLIEALGTSLPPHYASAPTG